MSNVSSLHKKPMGYREPSLEEKNGIQEGEL